MIARNASAAARASHPTRRLNAVRRRGGRVVRRCGIGSGTNASPSATSPGTRNASRGSIAPEQPAAQRRRDHPGGLDRRERAHRAAERLVVGRLGEHREDQRRRERIGGALGRAREQERDDRWRPQQRRPTRGRRRRMPTRTVPTIPRRSPIVPETTCSDRERARGRPGSPARPPSSRRAAGREVGDENRDDAAPERAQEAAEIEPRAADHVASHPPILAKSSENAGSSRRPTCIAARCRSKFTQTRFGVT